MNHDALALTIIAFTLVACPPTVPPSPVPPDATDASQVSVLDSAPGPQQCGGDKCCEACVQMARICGPQLESCVRTQAHIESFHEIREPGTARWQTCADVAAATDTVQMKAVGVHCGQ